LIRKIFNTLGTKVAIAAITFFIAIIISQYLGASGKGEQSLILITISFVIIFCNIVGAASIAYLIPRYSLSALFLPSYIWTFIVVMVSFCFLYFSKLLPLSLSAHICILSCLNALTSIHLSILIAKEQIQKNNLVLFIQSLLMIVTLGSLFIFFDKRTISAYLISLYSAYGVGFLLSLRSISPYLISLRLESIKKYKESFVMLAKYGWLNQCAIIAQLFSFRISYYLLNYYSGKELVGIYSNGIAIAESIWLISRSISLVAYSKIVNQTDATTSQKVVIEMSRLSVLACFFALLPLLVLPPGFYKLIFGHEFGPINRIIWFIAPGVFFFNLVMVISIYFSGTGKYYINAIASAAGLPVTIVASLILIPLMGAQGAALAASISYTVTALITIYYFKKESGCTFRTLLPSKTDLKMLRNNFLQK
jgi:O-antigen/teichoic acid export membrane protein